MNAAIVLPEPITAYISQLSSYDSVIDVYDKLFFHDN